MTQNDVVVPAGNGDIQVDEAGNSSEELVQISKAELEKIKGKAEKYHEVAGKYYKLKDSIKPNAPQENVQIPGMDEEQQAAFEKLAEKKAKEMLDGRERNDLAMKEEEAFLKANPGAYEKLDDIREMKRRNPELSHSKIYKFFFEEEPEAPKPQGIKGVAPKTIYQEGDLSPEAVNASLKNLMERK